MKYIGYYLIALCFIFVGCSSANVSTDYDRTANFNAYKTYSFHQKGLEKLELNDLDKNRIVSAIDQNLASKGFTKVQTGGDLVVNVLASSTKEVRVDNDYYGYGYGYWRGYYGGAPSTSISSYTAGKLVIDLIDDKKNVLVWQGIASDLNVSDVSSKAEKIPAVVTKVLQNFPPQAK